MLREIGATGESNTSDLQFLDELDSINQQIINDHVAAKTIEYPDLANEANALQAPYDFVEIQNRLLRAEVELLQTDLDSLEPNYWSDIITAAFACPSEVGEEVYGARAYYYQAGGPHPRTYDDSALCGTLDQRSLDSQDDFSYFQAYPNPFNDEITIVNLYDKDIRSISVVDLMWNQLIVKDDIDLQDSYKLSMADAAPGIYIINIIYTDNEIKSQKVIKVHY